MDAIKTLLFEDPMAIYCAAVFSELILLFIWWRRRTPRTGLLCIAPPVLGLLVGLTAHFVVTDREKIAATLNTLSRAAVRSDLPTVATLLDPSYNDGRYNKQTILAAIAVIKASDQLDGVKILMLKTQVDGDTATSRFRARLFKGDGPVGDTDWSVRWVRRNGHWVVIGSKLEEPIGVPMAPGA